MNNTKQSTVAVDAKAKAIAELLDDGFFDLMTGQQPESADDEVDDGLRLSRSKFAPTAFGPPIEGTIRANPIAKGLAVQSGEPTWCRCLTKDGLPVIDGSVGRSDANAVSPVDMIVKGQLVNINEFTHTVSKIGC